MTATRYDANWLRLMGIYDMQVTRITQFKRI